MCSIRAQSVQCKMSQVELHKRKREKAHNEGVQTLLESFLMNYACLSKNTFKHVQERVLQSLESSSRVPVCIDLFRLPRSVLGQCGLPGGSGCVGTLRVRV